MKLTYLSVERRGWLRRKRAKKLEQHRFFLLYISVNVLYYNSIKTTRHKPITEEYEMDKKYSLSIGLKEDQSVIMDIVVAKSGSQLITEAKVLHHIKGTNFYSRKGSDFKKVCHTTEVKRFSEKALQVHLDWISANKEALIEEAKSAYKLQAA